MENFNWNFIAEKKKESTQSQIFSQSAISLFTPRLLVIKYFGTLIDSHTLAGFLLFLFIVVF